MQFLFTKLTLLLSFLLLLVGQMLAQGLTATELGRYTDGRDGACEIAVYDAATEQLIITNAAANTVDLVDVSNLANPTLTTSVSVLPYGGGINSVANLGNGYFAAAIEDTIKQDSGKVVFFDMQGNYVSMLVVGALPDMLTPTKDGSKLLVACEGEPNAAYTVDPEGSIVIIDLSLPVASLTAADVTFLDFSQAPSTISGGVFKPNTSYATDLEPEYIAVNDNRSGSRLSGKQRLDFGRPTGRYH